MPETKFKKDEDFNEWYNEIVELSDLCDKRYPIKGMNVWRPYGWKIMSNIDYMIRKEMKETNHDEVNFPLLISESSFDKESEHIEGFESEVYWVTHAGTNELEERYLLRPTSETAMYPLFQLWIRSHADLPLKTYQIVNTFRYETKQTRAFIRVREIHFFEAHTCHVNFEEAEKQISEDKKIATKLFEELSLPFIFSKRPEWDKFAGADYTISMDVYMPSGRTLQLGSIHQYKDNFARPYDIKYENEEGEHQHCHQTTYGMSERIIGALVGVHGDNRGLILPPKVTPIQVIIVPIIFKETEKEVIEECEKLHKKLEGKGLRSKIDKRDVSPGSKFYDWELKGVPLRVEIGPRDIKNKQVVLVRRDTKDKKSEDKKNIVEKIYERLDKISEGLYRKAKKELEENYHRVTSIDEALEKKGGIIEIPWCRNESCADEIEEVLDGNALGEPIEKKDCDEKCPICGKKAETWFRFAKTY
ncbi:MAG: proline--tRNA ligase [Candidatus Thermoplasmatota archaeon]